MDNPNLRRALGLGIAFAAALLAVWLLWPSPNVAPDSVVVAPEPAPDLGQLAPPPSAAAATADGGDPTVVVVDDRDPSIPVTEKCTLIEGWAVGHVPDFTIMDNIRDGGMMFTEDDLACLTAARVPPAVVDHAERHITRNPVRK